jgi:hypothetical protein
MVTTTRRSLLRSLAVTTAALATPACAPGRGPGAGSPAELVVGPGAWCWFQSPRASIDDAGQLWLGSTQGTGAPVPGSVDVTQVDLTSGAVVARSAIGRDRVDDHTSPSVCASSGGVQVGWAAHARVDWLELGELGRPLQRIHRPGSLVAPGRGMSYVSAHEVAGERWVLYRGEGFTWNLLTSPDGDTWTARGTIVRPEPAGQRPYVLAASDGERLHVVASDGNPTEARACGVSALVIDADLTIREPEGRRIGAVGADAPAPRAGQRLFEGTQGAEEHDDVDGWTTDVIVAHRRPTALLTVRAPWDDDPQATGRWSHRHLWARQRSSGRWTVEPLAHGGRELYGNQPDYSGLGAIDPLDPTRVVISTDVHPETGDPLRSTVDDRVHHELFEGRRRSEGRWAWDALTSNSTEDNLRPVLAANGRWSALAWMRGTYRSWTDFDTHLVLRIA